MGPGCVCEMFNKQTDIITDKTKTCEAAYEMMADVITGHDCSCENRLST